MDLTTIQRRLLLDILQWVLDQDHDSIDGDFLSFLGDEDPVYLASEIDALRDKVSGTHAWVNEHSLDCPVTKYRANLMWDIAGRPHDRALLGALPEYDNGGDQEVESCTCPTMEEFGGHWHESPNW